MKRTITILATVLALAVFAVGCASGEAAPAAAEAPAVTEAPAAAAEATADASMAEASADSDETMQSGMMELTLAELAKYDGKNGNPAYVAVDGVIYDVSDLAKWKNGEHNGYSAGQDLTQIIKNKSPHGVTKLNGVPVVGKLIDG